MRASEIAYIQELEARIDELEQTTIGNKKDP
jgi:hypothetical protein